MKLSHSKSIIATGIIAIGVIIVSLLVLWKVSIDKADQHIHAMEELHQASVLIDKMRQIALHRTSLLNDMRLTSDPFDLDEIHQEISMQGSIFMVTRDELLGLNLSSEVRDIWEETYLAITKTGRAQYKTARLFIENRPKEAEFVMLNEAIPTQSIGQEGLSRLISAQQNSSSYAMQQAKENKQATYLTIASIGTIALLLTISILFLIIRMVR